MNKDYYENWYGDIPGKVAPWVLLIIGTIIALVSAYFYIPFYRACQALDCNVKKAISDYTIVFVKFAATSGGYFFFSILANIKFSRCSRFWGPGFGNIFGRVLIYIEYALYAFAIVSLFIA